MGETMDSICNKVRDGIDVVVGLSRSFRYERRLIPPDKDQQRNEWSRRLANGSQRDIRRDSIGRAYDGAMDRLGRIEAKAVGLLQVVAIVFGVLTVVALQDGWLIRVTAAIGLLFAGCATAGALRVLRVRQYRQVTSLTAAEPDGGLLSTALAAADIETKSVSPANFLHGAMHDLTIAAAAAAIGLGFLVIGIGPGTSAPAPAETTDSTSTSTTAPSQSTSVPEPPVSNPTAGSLLPTTEVPVPQTRGS